MFRFVLVVILAFFLFKGFIYQPQTPQQRAQEEKEIFRNLDNQLADHWGLPPPPVIEPKKEQMPESKPIPDDVDVDGEEDGTAHAFLFDGMVCFSKEKFAHGIVKCMDLKTKKSVSINASEISIPDDVYVDIPVGASVHIFSSQGKYCIAKSKFEKGLMKCWDPKTAENVSIDTRENPGD